MSISGIDYLLYYILHDKCIREDNFKQFRDIIFRHELYDMWENPIGFYIQFKFEDYIKYRFVVFNMSDGTAVCNYQRSFRDRSENMCYFYINDKFDAICNFCIEHFNRIRKQYTNLIIIERQLKDFYIRNKLCTN